MTMPYDRDPYEDSYDRCERCGCAITPHRRWYAERDASGKVVERPFWLWWCSGCEDERDCNEESE